MSVRVLSVVYMLLATDPQLGSALTYNKARLRSRRRDTRRRARTRG